MTFPNPAPCFQGFTFREKIADLSAIFHFFTLLALWVVEGLCGFPCFKKRVRTFIMHWSFYIYALALVSGWIVGAIVRQATSVPGFLDDGL